MRADACPLHTATHVMLKDSYKQTFVRKIKNIVIDARSVTQKFDNNSMLKSMLV